jgi:hypothetical protein
VNGPFDVEPAVHAIFSLFYNLRFNEGLFLRDELIVQLCGRSLLALLPLFFQSVETLVLATLALLLAFILSGRADL